jgi:hypothetical protein
MSAAELKQLVKQLIVNNVKIEVERLAEERGHTVLFTPAYHSDLQPIELVWALLVKGNVGRQYSNQTTLDMVYEHLMHEFNQLEDKGHRSINGLIEKCAALVLQFHGEMDAEDEMEDGDHDDASVIASDDGQDAPPDPPAAAGINRGDPGVIAVVKRVVLDPLPWCNGPGTATEPTKMRLPGIKNLYFYCFITSCNVLAHLVLYTNH